MSQKGTTMRTCYLSVMLLVSLLIPAVSQAIDLPAQVETTTPVYNNKEKHPLTMDASGNTKTTLGTLLNVEIPATPVFWISTGTSTDEHAVCTGPCRVESILAGNTSAVAAFLTCENDTAGNTVPGSETSTEFSMVIPGATTGDGFSSVFPVGKYFSTALTCWLVTDEALTGITAVVANKIRLNYDVKLCAVGAVYPQC